MTVMGAGRGRFGALDDEAKLIRATRGNVDTRAPDRYTGAFEDLSPRGFASRHVPRIFRGQHTRHRTPPLARARGPAEIGADGSVGEGLK